MTISQTFLFLMTLMVLSSSQVFFRMFLSLGLSDVFLWLDWGYRLLEKHLIEAKCPSHIVSGVMVNFICQVDWAKGSLIAGKTLFLGVSVRVFPEEISIWISRLNKAHGPHQCGWASSNLLRAWIKQKGRGRGHLLSAWPETSIFSCPWTSVLLVLRPLDSDKLYHQLSWFSSLQMANCDLQPP